MKKWIFLVVAVLLCLTACQKPYQTKVELGVNHEAINLPSFDAGYCYITVFSNGSWTISLADEPDWARLERNAGEGIGYVRLEYDENLDGIDRQTTVVVEGQGKRCEILVTQPKD